MRKRPRVEMNTTTGPLVLEDITAGYGALAALRNVSVTVPQGSVVALIGANGAGKSTLLRVASGLLAPWSGRIGIGSVDLTKWHAEDRATFGICHVPEGRGIFPALTVKENLIIQASRRGQSEDIQLAIDAFPILAERMNQFAGTLSGGQQQMLALARAYVSRARFILLDEVSLGLAPILVDQIYKSIADLAARGPALLLVEQYVNRALAVADDVYLLSNGTMYFHGKPSELDEEGVIRNYLGQAPIPSPDHASP